MTAILGESLAVQASLVRASVSIFDVLRTLGLMVDGSATQQILCPNPEHPERRPSARVYEDSNHVHCFTCGRTWDPLTLVRLVRRVGEAQALDWLSLHFALPDVGTMAPAVVGTLIKGHGPDYTGLAEHVAQTIRECRSTMAPEVWHRVWLAFDQAGWLYAQRQIRPSDYREALVEIAREAQP
jgi:hypothetical protein